MFFFSTTLFCLTILLIFLVLAVTCLLVRAGFIEEKVTTCSPDTVLRLSCDSDSVIRVATSFYGRMDNVTCVEGKRPDEISDTGCSLVSATDVVKKRCDGKKVCELSAEVFKESDPCIGTAKYLHTTFTCLPAFHRVTCEHSFAHLHCDEGQVIFVYGADYGRRDKATCVYDRPASQIQNTACSSPTNKVADSCNGKNSCIIKASNSVFGDPCYGTYKYLEMAYTCQYPEVSQDESVRNTQKCPFLYHHQSCLHRSGSSETMLHFRLSSGLLLTATCLLMASVASTERVISCDNNDSIHRLSCDNGVIDVQSALYGRTNRETCSQGRPPQQLSNTSCSQKGTVNALKKRCNGMKVCEINTSLFHTSDPCVGTFKYVDTNYTCLPANHIISCEHSSIDLYCDKGQTIFVYGANYGRTDQTTCINNRPASQIQNIYCSNPTTKVADMCNGKNRCTITASNSVFGDPCVGTFKYLEVAHVCAYH
ncbi:uncharacterized protein LOC121652113 [Melanotaenia boesemani]|uniref:uncharacterized protein LOC121652113 n=1 Tax=Melanotaenia boesemani TaxID=1250792 RepID=UPI001C049DF0|nr:uncharacterized protein LOC121652113 [Melanotaenia boesemani]